MKSIMIFLLFILVGTISQTEANQFDNAMDYIFALAADTNWKKSTWVSDFNRNYERIDHSGVSDPDEYMVLWMAVCQNVRTNFDQFGPNSPVGNKLMLSNNVAWDNTLIDSINSAINRFHQNDMQEHVDIVFGFDVLPHSQPWMLLMTHGPDVEAIRCGATLLQVREGIAKSDVALTAAHCVCGTNYTDVVVNKSDIHIHAGVHNISKMAPGQERRKVVNAVCFRGYKNTTFTNDLAVMKLNSPLNFTNTIHPVVLDHRNYKPILKNCQMYGWGAKSVGIIIHKNYTYPDDLLTMLVNELPTHECNQQFAYFLEDVGVCGMSGYPNYQRSCEGDSGGALMCKDGSSTFQRGIVSGAIGNCTSPVTFFVRVGYAPYHQWIQEKIKQLTSL